MRYNCIVVGAGPGGASAARRLAQAGVDVLVVDKATFPRYKPCGGAISALTARNLDFEWKHLAEAELHRVEVAHRFGKTLNCTSPKPYCHFVMRDKFDHLLAQKAIEAGATLKENCSFLDWEMTPTGVSVKTSQGTFQSDIVIGADGANSKVARLSNLGPAAQGIAMEAEIEADPDVLDSFRDSVYVSYGDPAGGYGWIFPKRHNLSVGVGSFGSQRRLKPSFHRLLEKFGLTEYPLRVFGHPIPMSTGVRPRHRARVALVGDAAGLADPLSGEGIAYAVRSGILAADASMTALDTGDFSMDGYGAGLEEELLSELNHANTIAEKFYAFPRVFFWLFRKSPRTLELYFDIVSGNLRYEDLWEHLQQEFLRFGLFRRPTSRASS